MQYLPTVNASLNALAAILLVVGVRLIRRGREVAHRRVMYAAFGVSTAFLGCYVIYHLNVGSMKFIGPPGVRVFYLGILLTHVVLAAAVPFLAVATIYLGVSGRRSSHRRLARWTYPIWLYVSITGVAIYLMLYHLYPPSEQATTIEAAAALRPAPNAAHP